MTYLLDEIPDGTRFTWGHSGFTVVGELAMSRLLGTVRMKMLPRVSRLIPTAPW